MNIVFLFPNVDARNTYIIALYYFYIWELKFSFFKLFKIVNTPFGAVRDFTVTNGFFSTLR